MTPQEWASAANKLSRANPGLTRAEIITKMNLQGMPRLLESKTKVLIQKATLGLARKHVAKDRQQDANNTNKPPHLNLNNN